MLEAHLRSRYHWRFQVEYERIDGTVQAAKRNEMITRFNKEPNERVSNCG